jgi:hypothetical protein
MSTQEEHPLITIKVSEIKEGDVFPGYWTAMEDASNLHDHYASCMVQYRDGGFGTREWNDPNIEIAVERTTA